MSTQTLERPTGNARFHTREFLFGRPLTAREVKLIDLAADGLPDIEIAMRLRISEEAIGPALSRAGKKLGVSGRTAAVAALYKRGVLKPSAVPSQPSVRLSRRQFEALLGLARGLTVEEIALEGALEVETVRSHIKRMRKRLGARDRAHAVRRGVDTGVLRLVRKDGEQP